MSAPTVSVVVPAFNYARYVGRAIDSALAQGWPPKALEIIVVDDGSTDGTADVLARYADRIRAIRKENGGLVSAVNAGVDAARGDYIALLDADDTWPAGRLAPMIEFLERRPEVGLLHGDLALIGPDDRPLGPTLFPQQAMAPQRGRVAGALLTANMATTSAIVVRAALRDTFHPIPAWSPWADCWITFRVAEVATIDHLDWPVANYRQHGDNAALGASTDRHRRALRRELPYRRWQLARVEPGRYPWPDAARAVAQLAATIDGAAGEGSAAAVVQRTAADRADAGRAAATARRHEAAGEAEPAFCAWVRAVAADPLDPDAREGVRRTAAVLQSRPAARLRAAPTGRAARAWRPPGAEPPTTAGAHECRTDPPATGAASAPPDAAGLRAALRTAAVDGPLAVATTAADLDRAIAAAGRDAGGTDAEGERRAITLATAARTALDAAAPGDAALAAGRAIGEDPGHAGARATLAAAVAAIAATAAALPLRGSAVLADAVDLVEAPDLLAAYGRHVGADDPVTLVIALPEADDPGLTRALVDAAAAAGLDGPGTPDLLAAPLADPAALADRAGALLGQIAAPAALHLLPRLGSPDAIATWARQTLGRTLAAP